MTAVDVEELVLADAPVAVRAKLRYLLFAYLAASRIDGGDLVLMLDDSGITAVKRAQFCAVAESEGFSKTMRVFPEIFASSAADWSGAERAFWLVSRLGGETFYAAVAVVRRGERGEA